MHYKNGRAAKVGDLVKGKGYNIKHEIIGLLLAANAAATACNCTVAHVDISSAVHSVGWRDSTSGKIAFPHNEEGTVPSMVVASLEYGQLDAFVALDPKTGDVLPPEVAEPASTEPPPPPPDKQEERGG